MHVVALPTIVLCPHAKKLLRSARGVANSEEAASCDSTMGGRGQLVLYHSQLRAPGQKPVVPCRHRRGCARCYEIQPRATHLALSIMSAYACLSACHYRIPARTGNANHHHELEEVHRRKMWRGLATRFL